MRASLRPRLLAWACPLLLASVTLAGCLAPAEEALDPSRVDPAALLARPWLDNWEVVGLDLAFDYDPRVPHVAAEGTLTLENPLGEARPWVVFFLSGFEVTDLRDEEGREVPFTQDRAAPPFGGVLEDVAPGSALWRGFNATLEGDVAPGARRTLTIAYEGWTTDATVPVPGADEWSANYHSLAPTTTSKRNPADNRFTLRSPADWVVLGAAGLEHREVGEDGWQVATYRNHEPRVLVYSADGLQWFEDHVDGIEVRTHYFPDMRPQGEAMHQTNLRILHHLPEWTGPYPYDHMWTVPHQVTLNAFNTPAMSFMGWVFSRPGLPGLPVQFGRDLLPVVAGQEGFENVLVHEQTHNWWGQMVRGNSSDASLGTKDTWMSEGITTYLAETVWLDRLYGEEAAKEAAEHMVRDQQRDRANRDGEERGITEAQGDHYVKTALALRALEAYAIATGRPDAVLDALRSGQEAFGRQHGGSGLVTTEAMLAHFDASFGESLAWWWEPWFFGRELPDLAVAGVAVEAQGRALNVTVANLGGAGSAALVQAETLAGQRVRGWAVVDADATAHAVLDLTGVSGPVLRVVVDPLQHVNEWDEGNNAWTMAAADAGAAA